MRRWFDLPLRAGLVALFVAGVVSASSLLGPQVTGIATMFPITFLSLIVLVQPRLGTGFTALMAATALRAMLGFGLMLLTLHLTVERVGVAAAYVLSLSVSLAWSAGVLALRSRR
jgi:hypothetical protein